MYSLKDKKRIVDEWFNYLQIQISSEFQKIENSFSKKPAKFKTNKWRKKNINEGGGTSMLLSEGKVFEKVGVNKSCVTGKFSKNFQDKILGAKESGGKYWASGVSVVAHMRNPKIPALHFNTRFIVTSKEWFGGGIDATPSFKDLGESKIFHKKLKNVCIANKKNYKKFKKWCDNYFFLPNRNEPRGIGGIFFDYEIDNWLKNFKFVRDVGLTFIDLSKIIINRKIKKTWSKKDKIIQSYKRGRYVEFNLLYDRGTKFGLNSGGNVQSILMSLPPTAKWK